MKTKKQSIDLEHKGNEKHHFKLRLALLSLCMLTFIEGYSQTGQVNLNLKNATVKELFREIEKQTSYRFSYRDIEIDNKGGITISGQGKELKEVLTNELAKQQLSYVVSGNKIIVSTAKKEAVSTKEKKITGKVIDTKGEPVIGATIMEKGTTNGTITDFDGNFTLNVSDNSMIEVSYIGYQSQSIKANPDKLMTITLKEETEMLDEVVVVGYGTQKKINLSGAISMVKVNENLSSRSITSTSSALNGLVPGLIVQQSSGMAGNDGATLRIRGMGTVNNNDPLIVVDGIPDINIDQIDMNDIESISVLKDASSASAYGSRAANGVILITTKKGKSGKANIKYSGNFSWASPSNFYESLSNYPRAMILSNTAQTNSNMTTSYLDTDIDEWLAKGLIDPILYPNTDWWNVIFRSAFTHTHNVSASGGNNNGSYFLSVGALNQEGLMICNDYKRYSFRANLDQKINKYFKVGLNISGQWSEASYPYDNGLLSYGNSATWILTEAPAGILPKHPITGEYGGGMTINEKNNNPLSQYEQRNNIKEQKDFSGIGYIEWSPIKDLKLRADYSLTYRSGFVKSWNIPHNLIDFHSNTIAYEAIAKSAPISNKTNESQKSLINFHVIYNKEIYKGHNLGLNFIYSEEYWHTREQTGSRNNRFHPNLSEIDAATLDMQQAGGNSSAEGLRSVMTKFNYDIKNKYMLQALIRWDASSKFSKGNQWGTFPSISAAWRFSEEKFFNPLNVLVNNGKLRISYGTTGNNAGVGRYDQKDVYNSYPYTFGSENYLAEGYAPYKLIDPSFTWESTKMTDIGLDISLFNNKLSFELDFYNKLTIDMIRPGEISSLLSGYEAPDKNIGKMLNRGFELNMQYNNNIASLFYGISINYAYNKNKLLKWNERLGRGEIFEGYPYQMVYTYKAKGIAQTWEDVNNAPYHSDYLSPGDLIIEDINGDGVISSSDQISMPNTMRYLPKHDFSFDVNAKWNGFDINIFFQGNAGRKNFWIDKFNETVLDATGSSLQTIHQDSWSLENRNALLPRLIGDSTSSGGYNQSKSTFWLYSCNYLRLKNIQLGYSIPTNILAPLGIKSLRVYLSGENLLTFTKWPGLDPEKRPKDGYEQPYPLTKTLSFGLNINF